MILDLHNINVVFTFQDQAAHNEKATGVHGDKKARGHHTPADLTSNRQVHIIYFNVHIRFFALIYQRCCDCEVDVNSNIIGGGALAARALERRGTTSTARCAYNLQWEHRKPKFN